MRRFFRIVLVGIVASVATWPADRVEAGAPILDLARLLDDYAAGRFERALGAVEAAGEAQATLLRTQWRGAGRLWIDAEPEAKSQRLLAAASFALETERLNVERGAWLTPITGACQGNPRDADGWVPGGPCVLEWAWSLLVERGTPDWAERTWVLAASSLISGVRDFRFLYRPGPAATPDARGLVADALARHPEDPRLRLEQAIALASRFNVTTDGGGPAQQPPVTIVNFGGRGRGLGLGRGQLPASASRPDSRDNVVALLTALAEDPQVGPEARIRLGYLLWATGESGRAREELKRAAAATRDRDLQYLAQFLRGWFALRAGQTADAIPDFEAALEARPHSQSASLALASLELQRGEAARAHDLARTSFASLPDDADPWRVFLYGHYPALPSLVAELRRHVRP